MNASETSSTPPPENATPTVTQMAGSDQWIMMSLNMLREDIKGIKSSIDNVDSRLSNLEHKISRATYTIGGVILTLTLVWGGYEVLSKFVDIKVTPKEQTEK